jgi:hypothetical protein
MTTQALSETNRTGNRLVETGRTLQKERGVEKLILKRQSIVKLVTDEFYVRMSRLCP